MESLKSIISIAAAGMRAQGQRLKVVAENVANAGTTGSTPGADPYRRKLVSFEEMIDRETGDSLVQVRDVTRDKTPFTERLDPAHPAADENGFVKVSNVNPIIEMSNMREASRSYEANMNMFEAGRKMRSQIIDLLR